jgi:uncharacterized membrane protein YeaQ/YmgE (transglycosylase-associated protein family)
MTIGTLVLLLIIAGICGALGQMLVSHPRTGCLGSMAIGFVGALLGTWLAGVLGLPDILSVRVGAQVFPIVWSIVGAALLVLLLTLATRSWRTTV